MNNTQQEKIPYGVLGSFVAFLAIINIALSQGELSKGEGSLAFLFFFVAVPFIAIPIGLLIAIRPTNSLKFYERLIRGVLIAAIIIQLILALIMFMIQ